MKILRLPIYNIGIIGRGFVGSAIESFLCERLNECSVATYDITDDCDIETGYRWVVQESDIIYLCLPTPEADDGSCDTGIVEKACTLLNHEATLQNKMPIVLIKSTLAAGTTDQLQQDDLTGSSLILVPNPEFLTERTARSDFAGSSKHLIGIKDHLNNPIRDVLTSYHAHLWPNSLCVFTEPIEAELVKQLTNTYFCMKVIFANHIYQLCQSLNIDYSDFMCSALMADPRLGQLHWKVPGPDGKLGFGGNCFSKDLSGMISLFEELNVPCDILKMVREYNINLDKG